MSDPQEAAQQATDRKSLLAQQFEEVEQQAEQAPAAPQGDAQQQAATAARARDEAGKFVAKKEGAAQPEKQADAQRIAADPAQNAQASELKAWERAPKSWKKEHWDSWTGLPEPVRQYIHTREDQMRAGSEPLLPKAEFADKISRVAEPYMNTIRGLGIDLPQAVEGLMRVDHELRTLPPQQRLQRLMGIAQAYGIDLSGQAQNAQMADPNVNALQNELLGIKGQFTSFLQQQEAAQQRGALDEVSKFSAHAEYFEEARPMMVQLLQGGMADTLSDAYEKAIRLDPELFDKVQSAKQAATEAEKSKAADAAAKRARAAAVSVKSGTPGAQKTTNAQDRRSMLIEQFDGLSERL